MSRVDGEGAPGKDGESLRLVPLQQIAYRTALCLVPLHALATAALEAGPRGRNQSVTPAEPHGHPTAVRELPTG
ncbi:hypothetical protein [Streptomyces globisporus]|uniref:hypothetical protein n=1 Tax=Streptomyces globisporus TaxID=1908 RepID=UPI0004C94518|nr:hypothetical protein [Streptomyces globisporus]